jgi:hypothetical protein
MIARFLGLLSTWTCGFCGKQVPGSQLRCSCRTGYTTN